MLVYDLFVKKLSEFSFLWLLTLSNPIKMMEGFVARVRARQIEKKKEADDEIGHDSIDIYRFEVQLAVKC